MSDTLIALAVIVPSVVALLIGAFALRQNARATDRLNLQAVLNELHVTIGELTTQIGSLKHEIVGLKEENTSCNEQLMVLTRENIELIRKLVKLNGGKK